MTRDTKIENPPSTVVTAAWLYLAYGLVTGIRICVFRGGPPASIGAAVAWVLIFCYFLFVARSLYVGRNWVRWLLVVLWLLALASWPWTAQSVPPWPELSIYVLQIALSVFAVVLTFTPRARAWFRPNNSFKPTPLRGTA